MKVCILSNDAPAAFQSSINAFIADKKVIDIKYQSMMLPLKFTIGHAEKSPRNRYRTIRKCARREHCYRIFWRDIQNECAANRQ